MEKQEVLEKIIYYLTKQSADNFYEQKKGKYYINILEIENIFNRKTKASFSNDEENFNDALQQVIEQYKSKQLTYPELKNEVSRILYNESNKIDKLLSENPSITQKRKIVEENIKSIIIELENNLKKIDIKISDFNVDFCFTNYILFVHEFHEGRSKLFEMKDRLYTNESYIDFMCRESVLENIVKEHYKYMKDTIKRDHENKKNKREYYNAIKNVFLGITKEEIFLPIEKLWNIKLDLDILYYVPSKKENKLSSFYYMTDKQRINYHLKLDPHLYATVNVFQQLYLEEAVEAFRNFYKCIFGDNNYRKNFLTIAKNRAGWPSFKTLFVNVCIVSNTHVLGEFLRNLTKEKKFYEEATFEKLFPSYINQDLASQKIKSGIETQKQYDDYLLQCFLFDRKDEIDYDFEEKIEDALHLFFDNYRTILHHEEKQRE